MGKSFRANSKYERLRKQEKFQKKNKKPHKGVNFDIPIDNNVEPLDIPDIEEEDDGLDEGT